MALVKSLWSRREFEAKYEYLPSRLRLPRTTWNFKNTWANGRTKPGTWENGEHGSYDWPKHMEKVGGTDNDGKNGENLCKQPKVTKGTPVRCHLQDTAKMAFAGAKSGKTGSPGRKVGKRQPNGRNVGKMATEQPIRRENDRKGQT